MDAELRADCELVAETWLPIPGYEGMYDVSDQGRVRSWVHKNGRRTNPYLMKSSASTRSYPVVQMHARGDSQAFYVHRLVLRAFVGPLPLGMQGAHLNGDPTDNRLVNLRYVTATENIAHKKLHGTELVGEKANFAKLTDKDVQTIRQLHESGVSSPVLAKMFGVHRTTIHRVFTKRSWGHV